MGQDRERPRKLPLRDPRTPPALPRQGEIGSLFPILVEQSLVGIYLVQDGRFRYVNPRLAELFDYTPAEVLALPSLLALVDERDHHLVHRNLQRRLEGEVRELRYTFRGRRRDGSILLAEVHGSRAEIEGRPAVIGTLLDVTEQREAERRLRESEQRFRLMVEGSEQVFFYIHDREGRFHYLSPSVRDVIGYDAEDLLGRSYEEILDEDQEEVRRLTDRALMEGIKQQPYRAAVRNPAGRRVVLEIVETPRIRDGEVIGMRGFARDITARVETERERDRLYEEARSAIAARDEMLAVVSHDLRSPLNTIRMCAAMLDEDPTPDRARQVAGMVERAVDQMDGLIADLLDVSRVEAGGFTLSPSEMDPVPLLEEAYRLSEGTAEANDLQIVPEVPPELPPVRADGKRVMQVLTNLLSNAVKFTPEGGRIVLRAAPEGDAVRITVADNGRGIPREDLPRLFDRFWRGGGKEGAGAGLGLAICKGIVEAHGGRIWVESSDGEGTAFHFTLPVAAAG
jgi:PAS domain S-box-containing protein